MSRFSAAVLIFVAIFAIGVVWFYRGSLRRFLRSFVSDVWTAEELPDQKQKLWDARLKIIAAIGVIATGCWAVYSYNSTAEMNFRKPLWDKQLSLYFDATEAAAKYVATDDPVTRAANKEKFWTLYYGSLAVVEDDTRVCTAMADFGLCLPKPGRPHSQEVCDPAVLRHRALLLAEATRMSIGEQWDTKLDNLRKPPGDCRNILASH